MIIKSIFLQNFRNYKEEKLDFIKDINIIYGENAQGKTNILESIYLCSTARSHRTTKVKELIKSDSEKMKVSVDVEKNETITNIEFNYIINEKKLIKINEIPIKKTGELMGQLSAVIFAPEDLFIIKDGPSERRRYIDIMISRIKPSYFYSLQRYFKIIKQKNSLLKEIQKDRKKEYIKEIWDITAAKEAIKIIKERSLIIKELNNNSKIWHNKISNEKEKLIIEYENNMDVEIKNDNKEEMLKEIIKKIKKLNEREIETGNTLIGPHRDDIKIKINDKSLKAYGSQGQQRTAVLSMKLSEIDIIKKYTDEYPILLLDDIMSELDEGRRKKIIENIKNIQTFITCTDYEYFKKTIKRKIKYFKIENGKLIEEK